MLTKISKWSRIQDSFWIITKVESLVVYAISDIPGKFQKDPSITFRVILLTHRQTNKQTNKVWQKHYFIGEGNNNNNNTVTCKVHNISKLNLRHRQSPDRVTRWMEKSCGRYDKLSRQILRLRVHVGCKVTCLTDRGELIPNVGSFIRKGGSFAKVCADGWWENYQKLHIPLRAFR